jgi:hypothetical protein
VATTDLTKAWADLCTVHDRWEQAVSEVEEAERIHNEAIESHNAIAEERNVWIDEVIRLAKSVLVCPEGSCPDWEFAKDIRNSFQEHGIWTNEESEGELPEPTKQPNPHPRNRRRADGAIARPPSRPKAPPR